MSVLAHSGDRGLPGWQDAFRQAISTVVQRPKARPNSEEETRVLHDPANRCEGRLCPPYALCDGWYNLIESPECRISTLALHRFDNGFVLLHVGFLLSSSSRSLGQLRRLKQAFCLQFPRRSRTSVSYTHLTLPTIYSV